MRNIYLVLVFIAILRPLKSQNLGAVKCYNGAEQSAVLSCERLPEDCEALKVLDEDSAIDTVGMTEFVKLLIDSNSHDCVSVIDFGATGDGTTDDYQAFRDALDAMPVESSRAGKLCIPCGSYFLSQTLNLYNRIQMEGEGSANSCVELVFKQDGDGIFVWHNQGTSLSNGASPTYISNIRIRQTAAGTTGNGIRTQAQLHLEDVSVDGFAEHGIFTRATLASTDSLVKGSASLWYYEKVNSSNNGGDGFRWEGADVNAGVSVNINATNNGGYGIYDGAFLGNTHIAPHTIANTLAPYKTVQTTAHHWFLGAYAESGQPPIELVSPTVFFEGNNGAGDDGNGILIKGSSGALTNYGEYETINEAGTTKVTTVVGGEGGNMLLTYKVDGDAALGYRMTFEDSTGDIWLMHNGNSMGRAIGYTTDLNTRLFGRSTAIGGGYPVFNNGIFLNSDTGGGINANRYLGFSTAIPAGGEWAKGDRLMNSDPDTGEPSYWICTVAGTPGTWVGLDLIP